MWIENPTYAYVDENGSTVTFKGRGEVSLRTFGLYIQLKYFPLSNLHITLSGRYDYNSHYKHSVFNPRAGIVYHISEKLTTKFLYGNAFISPSMWSNYLFWMAPFYGHVNPESFGLSLNPEKLRNIEWSLTYKLTNNFLSSLTVYQHFSEDIITNRFYKEMKILDTPEGPISINPTGVRGIETSVNSGEQNVLGMDLTINYKFLPKWTIDTNYSYITGKVKERGEETNLPKVSQHKINIGISGELFNHFSFSLRNRWISEIETMPSNSYEGKNYGGDNKLDGYFLTNFYIRVFNFVKGLEFSLRIDNLFDSRIYGVGLDNENDDYGNVFPKVPFDPRTVLVGVSYRF
ncbi:MAG: TonB-dependent receptor [Endomicrobia bacterium]|nr:TonB-dependent receptor [Endomicrobiia bacterium]